jgi:hypothetical protein
MFRYKLRTLMIALALGPALMAGVFFTRHFWPPALAIALIATATAIPIGFAMSCALALVFRSRG